ncbi:MAG: hypothetical protein JSR97_07510, partial [Verrucomicrobia bacterium]|nr:hypothetical protein [Verrucomicrobiota bacterium]
NNSPLPQKRRNHVSDGYAIPKHGCSLHPTPEEVGFTAQRIKAIEPTTMAAVASFVDRGLEVL